MEHRAGETWDMRGCNRERIGEEEGQGQGEEGGNDKRKEGISVRAQMERRETAATQNQPNSSHQPEAAFSEASNLFFSHKDKKKMQNLFALSDPSWCVRRSQQADHQSALTETSAT